MDEPVKSRMEKRAVRRRRIAHPRNRLMKKTRTLIKNPPLIENHGLGRMKPHPPVKPKRPMTVMVLGPKNLRSGFKLKAHVKILRVHTDDLGRAPVRDQH